MLMIDFDVDEISVNSEGVERRLEQMEIPDAFAKRVFILGTLGEPEQLKQAGLGSFENIGSRLARDCRDKTTNTWQHALLKHNMAELNRAYTALRPILFPND